MQRPWAWPCDTMRGWGRQSTHNQPSDCRWQKGWNTVGGSHVLLGGCEDSDDCCYCTSSSPVQKRQDHTWSYWSHCISWEADSTRPAQGSTLFQKLSQRSVSLNTIRTESPGPSLEGKSMLRRSGHVSFPRREFCRALETAKSSMRK